jgi:hypothetical protein
MQVRYRRLNAWVDWLKMKYDRTHWGLNLCSRPVSSLYLHSHQSVPMCTFATASTPVSPCLPSSILFPFFPFSTYIVFFVALACSFLLLPPLFQDFQKCYFSVSTTFFSRLDSAIRSQVTHHFWKEAFLCLQDSQTPSCHVQDSGLLFSLLFSYYSNSQFCDYIVNT